MENCESIFKRQQFKNCNVGIDYYCTDFECKYKQMFEIINDINNIC